MSLTVLDTLDIPGTQRLFWKASTQW